MKPYRGDSSVTGEAISAIIYLAIFIAFVVGYIGNIVKLIGLFGDGFTAELIIRLVGVFAAPLGAIAGYI